MQKYKDKQRNGSAVILPNTRYANWSHKDDGWYKIWVNNKLVYEYHGPTKVKAGKIVFRFGIYRSFISRWEEQTNVDWSKCDDYMKPLFCYDMNNKVIPESERKIIDPEPMPITVIYYDEIRFGKTKEKVVGNLSPLQ